MNGASARRASRRAISVLPTPVGPIIRMFLGVISCRSGSPTCWRRHRFLNAIATARLAASCPTMCLLSSWTISDGVMRNDMGFLAGKIAKRKTAAHLGAAVQFYPVRGAIALAVCGRGGLQARVRLTEQEDPHNVPPGPAW